MQITDVRVKKFKDSEVVKGIAAITFDDCFVVHDVKIIKGKEGLFIAMPSKKIPSGTFKDIAHPINQETRSMIQTAVLDQYEITEY